MYLLYLHQNLLQLLLHYLSNFSLLYLPYFKDLVEAIKTYLVEYPKKQNFPASVYNAAFDLVEFATSQFEDNTKQIETLIRQRELNISLGGKLKDLLNKVDTKEKNWKDIIIKYKNMKM